MADIIAHIMHVNGGDSSITPLPISVEINWIIPEPIAPQSQGLCALFLDPALNRPQMEAQLREQLAACVTEITGILFVASDVRGVSI